MTTRLILPPTEEPLTLAEVKASLRKDNNDEDALIGSWIIAAQTARCWYSGIRYAGVVRYADRATPPATPAARKTGRAPSSRHQGRDCAQTQARSWAIQRLSVLLLNDAVPILTRTG